jgi:CheY-like chemotaxis protein
MPNDNIWIMADPVRMEQIIVNILTNAAKYTDVGGSIVLKAEVYADGLTIWIKDNGVGIAPEMLEKIFDPFVQVKYNFNRSAGLGIGLSLTKRLVELHDGIIKAESAGRNLGSVFIINFPKSILSGAPVVRPSLEPKANIKRTENHGPTKNILVVDDNKPAAIGLMKLLERKGHHVSAAFEGNEALEELRRSKPQVVLLDIGMPGMDGYQVAEEIRKEHGEKGPLLIAITGYGQETDKEKAQSYGFNHHLTKPVRIADIEKILTLDEAARSLI